MNTDVFEIIGELVKKLLHDQDIIENEEEIISSLKQRGYDTDDINQAFEFIFSSSNNRPVWEKLPEGQDARDSEKREGVINRVFDIQERYRLNLNVQGIIYKLLDQELLTLSELEEVIAKSMAKYSTDLDTLKFWEALTEVIDDEFRSTLISEKIPEFKIANAGRREKYH